MHNLKNSAHYILVTPVKNEAANLERLFVSVSNQTVQPALWFIMNDGSTDNSLKLISNFGLGRNNIVHETLPSERRDLTWRYHRIMHYGFERATRIALNKGLNWEYIGVLDGDVFLDDSNYFEFLMKQADTNKKVGICSGLLRSFNGKGFVAEHRHRTAPTGAARLIKKEVYFQIGYPIIPSADSIMLQRARDRGYKTIWYNEVVVSQSRMTTSAAGYWSGYLKKGQELYYLGHSLTYASLYFVRQLFRYPFFHAFAFYGNYLFSYAFGKEKTSEADVLEYRQHIVRNRLKEFLRIV